MIHPERIILIAVMAGVVSAGFTWFGWELVQNIFAIRRNRPAPAPVAEQTPPRGAAEKTAEKPAPKREAKQKRG